MKNKEMFEKLDASIKKMHIVLDTIKDYTETFEIVVAASESLSVLFKKKYGGNINE